VARYRTPEGKERSRSHATEKEARAFLTTVDHDKLAGTYVDPRLGGDRTVRQWSEEWFPLQRFKRASTGQRMAYAIRRLNDLVVDGTNKGLGDRKLRGLQQMHLEAWLNALKARYAPATVASIWGGAAALFKAAVVNHRIPSSPCYGVKLRLDDTPEIVVPTVEEVMAIHAHLPERWRDLALFQARTGLRPGEALGLQVEQLVLRVPQPYVRVDRQFSGGKLVPWTKTANSYGRQVPLDPGTKALIAAHLLRYPPGADGRVFPVNNPRVSWPKAVKDAGIDRQVRMHDMRHFYASQLYGETHDWALVAKRLGDTEATTMRIYVKVVPQSEDRARGVMDRVFASVRVRDV
jgi:integrase